MLSRPLLLLLSRGGPIVTVGAALLFFWMAINGERPAGWSYEGEPSEAISGRERLFWAGFGIALIGYEYWKFRAVLEIIRTGAW